MHAIFVYMGGESLGVEYLISAARGAGHTADLLFDPAVFGGNQMWDIPIIGKALDMRHKIVGGIVDSKPDIVAFSCATANFKWMTLIAEEVKKLLPEIKTVFGGPHVMAVPERVFKNDAVDSLVCGEADEVFPALLTSWDENAEVKLPGVWEKRTGKSLKWDKPFPIAEIEKLPFPAKDVFYRKVPSLEVCYMAMTSRGCPFKCTYCCKPLSGVNAKGHGVIRRRSPANVVAELEPVKMRGISKIVRFVDDVFTLDTGWMAQFADLYAEKINIPYFCYTYPSTLDREKARLLAESGCVFVTFGVQSADELLRLAMTKRRYSNEQVRETAALLKEHNIKVSIEHIVGFPGDTPEIMKNAAIFYSELRPDRLFSYWLNYFPGTEILNMACETGHLSNEDREIIENGEAGAFFGNSGLLRHNPEFRKHLVMFSLIPLLPHKWIKLLLNKKIFRWFPGLSVLSNFFIVMNSLRIKDPFFFFNIRYIFSRKHVP